MEASFWKRLWTCRQTEYWMNEWKWTLPHKARIILLFFLIVCRMPVDKLTVFCEICRTFRMNVPLIISTRHVAHHVTLTFNSFFTCTSLDYTLIANFIHWLLFIHKILFSSTCFRPQVLIFRRIQLYTCSIWYCHSLWEFLVACRYTAWVSPHSSCLTTSHQELS